MNKDIVWPVDRSNKYCSVLVYFEGFTSYDSGQRYSRRVKLRKYPLPRPCYATKFTSLCHTKIKSNLFLPIHGDSASQTIDLRTNYGIKLFFTSKRLI